MEQFEIIVDDGKPYSVFVDNQNQVMIILTKLFLDHTLRDDDGFKIYEGDKDITECQWVEEFAADLLELERSELIGGN